MAYVRDLVVAGLYHPDALTIADSTRARDALIGSKFVLDVETFGNAWQDAWTRGPKLNPPVTPAGGPAVPGPRRWQAAALLRARLLRQHRLQEGSAGSRQGAAAHRQLAGGAVRQRRGPAADDRRQGHRLHASSSDGSITVLPASNTDANSVPWKYIVQRPQVAYWPGIPDYAKAATDFEKVAIRRRRGGSDARLRVGDAGRQGRAAGPDTLDRRHHRPARWSAADAATSTRWSRTGRTTAATRSVPSWSRPSRPRRVSPAREPFRFGVNSVTTSRDGVAGDGPQGRGARLRHADRAGPFRHPVSAVPGAGGGRRRSPPRLRLATLVLDNDFRHPAVVAKEAATRRRPDGAADWSWGWAPGWLQADYTKTGLSFDPPAVRLARLAESVQICKAFLEQRGARHLHAASTTRSTSWTPLAAPDPAAATADHDRRSAAADARARGARSGHRGPVAAGPARSGPATATHVRAKGRLGARGGGRAVRRPRAARQRRRWCQVTEHRRRPNSTAWPRARVRRRTQVRASPGSLVGSVDAIVEKLQARREHMA